MYAAILLATEGAVSGWALEWVGWYLVGKVVLGVLAGIVVGRVLAYAAFHSRSRSLRLAERGRVADGAGGPGVGVRRRGGRRRLRVPRGLRVRDDLRSAERSHDYHAAMHEVTERLERLLTLFVLLVLGIALTRGLLGSLDWKAWRSPSRSWSWSARSPAPSGCTVASEPGERRAGGVLRGARGRLDLHLAYAGGEATELASDWLWSTVSFTIVLSVFVHGALAAPVMRRVGASSARTTLGRCLLHRGSPSGPDALAA